MVGRGEGGGGWGVGGGGEERWSVPLYILLKNLKILFWQQSYMDAFGWSASAGDGCTSNIYGLTLSGSATHQFTASQKWKVISLLNYVTFGHFM